MSRLDLAGFAARLGELKVGIGAVEHAVLDRAALLIEAEVKRTIEDHQGAIEKSAPRISDLCDSIGHTVRASQAHVGSNHPEIEYRELGTRTTHPCSFLTGAAFRRGIDVRDLIGDHFFRYIAGIGERG
jgi:hypothetical protein